MLDTVRFVFDSMFKYVLIFYWSSSSAGPTPNESSNVSTQHLKLHCQGLARAGPCSMR